MQEIIQAIQEHATPRLYDWLVLAVAGVAIVVSGLAAFYAYKLNKEQSKILKQQNKIALFDKRYELFKITEQLFINVMIMSSDSYKKDIFQKCDDFLMKYTLLNSLFRDTFQYELSHELSKAELTNKGLKILEEHAHDILIYLERIELLFVLTDQETKLYDEIMSGFAGMVGYFSSFSGYFKKETTVSLEEIFDNNLARLQKISEFNTILKQQLYLVNKQPARASKPCKTTE